MVMQCAGAPVALNKSEVPVDKLINCCAEPGKRIWVFLFDILLYVLEEDGCIMIDP